MIDPITNYILEAQGVEQYEIENLLYDKFVEMMDQADEKCDKFHDIKDRKKCLIAEYKRVFIKWSTWASGASKKRCAELAKVYEKEENIPFNITMKKCLKYAAMTASSVKQDVKKSSTWPVKRQLKR